MQCSYPEPLAPSPVEQVPSGLRHREIRQDLCQSVETLLPLAQHLLKILSQPSRSPQ